MLLLSDASIAITVGIKSQLGLMIILTEGEKL